MMTSMPVCASAFNRFTSSIPATPPEAITGIEMASASSAVASAFTPQCPIPVDVSEYDRGYARVLKRLGKIQHGHVRLLRPTLDSDHAFSCIDANDNPARMRSACGLDRFGSRSARVPRDHACDTAIQPRFDPCQVTNAAAQLHGRVCGGQCRRNRFGIGGTAIEGAIQIDQMQLG